MLERGRKVIQPHDSGEAVTSRTKVSWDTKKKSPQRKRFSMGEKEGGGG